MTDEDRCKYRLEALNLAYGILNQKLMMQLQAPKPGSTILQNYVSTEQVLAEAEKLIQFIKVP